MHNAEKYDYMNDINPRCSGDPDNFHHTLITIVLSYIPHSGDNALTQVILVLRKITCTVLLYIYCPNLVFMPVNNNEHQKIDDISTECMVYSH